MADLCRLCAAVHKKEMLTNCNYEMCQKLNECFGVEICQTGDELPKCACNKCLTRLQEAYEFFKRIKESQESLMLLYDVTNKKSTNEKSPEISTNVGIEDILMKREVVCGVANGASADVMLVTTVTSDTTALNFNEIDGENKETENENYELYQVMECDEDNLLEKITHERNDSNEAAEIINAQIDSNEEVETYTFNVEEVESLLEDDKNIDEDYEDEDNELVHKTKPTAIPSPSQTNIANEDPQSHQQTNDINQIFEWKDYSWICYVCSQMCPSYSVLLQHAQEQHDAIDHTRLQYECADCHKILNYHKFLNHVRYRHHTELQLRCDVCDAQHNTYAELAHHRKSGCGEAQLYPLIHLCETCGKSFHNQSTKSWHERSQHNCDTSKIKFHKCSHCDKQFTMISNLRLHEKLHSGIKEFTCDICDHKFFQKNNLEAHLFTHIGGKGFRCKICLKSFKTPANLEQHLFIHKDIKVFSCDYCDKEFRRKDEKISHERTHTGEKPFKCKFCDRSYKFRSGLKCHVSVHTGELPYSCQNCDRRFTNWGNMNKHLKRCSKKQSNNGDDET